MPEARSRRPRFLLSFFVIAASMFVTEAPELTAQEMEMVGGSGSANFDLAARFAPYKFTDMVHSTTVAPNWIEGGERFCISGTTRTGRSTTWLIRFVARRHSSSTTTAWPQN